MASWKTFKDESPELAGKVEARLRAHKHHVMATVRRDGAPRVSGTEVEISGDELYLGSMWEARKALDLRRDPRLAVHTNPGEETMEGGDAKFSATAIEVPDGDPAKERIRDEVSPPEPFHQFRLDLSEVVLTEVDQEAELLSVHLWRPGRGVTTTSRT
ncbi:MAG TPA: pyridoxamine 5'-phosphate oxidase family protein [Acidimicrobiales bacterium]